MIALLLAAALLQSAPDAAATAAPQAKLPSLQAGGLPKDDYGLVAWCHGAVAGQLELDPIVKADMEKIEGKAKVEARAASDAEMEKERRAFLKDYEHALAAAEAASPTYIHEAGVRAEERGYGMWTPTRNKAPIWRMLDWGMWDPNDVGCNDAAKRLYEKSKLFGEALKGSDAAPAQTDATPADRPAATVAEAPKVDAPPAAMDVTPSTQPSPAGGDPAKRVDTPAAAVAEKKTTKAVKKSAKAKPVAKPEVTTASSSDDVQGAIARGKAELAAAQKGETASAPAPTQDSSATPPALRGSQ